MEIEIVTFAGKGCVNLIVPPDRPTEVNPFKKHTCCSPSCLWSHFQEDKSDLVHSPSGLSKLIIRHRCNVCGIANCFPCREQILYKFNWVWVHEICRLRDGHNLFPLKYRLSVKRTFLAKSKKMLSTRNSSVLWQLLQYSCYLNQSVS